jgi:D-alanyl-D-alanine carboxypeptidase
MVVGQSSLPMLTKLHQELGIPDDYGREGGLPQFDEALDIVEVGPNLIGRQQSLMPETARQWQEMVVAAASDGIALMIVSGFRSIEYQAALIRKKINAGQTIGEILAVNAAPGYSEHHSGRAVDIATPGSRPLTEEFESSDAFRWLVANAKKYGFSLSYPRNNSFGFIYEPWHWSTNS